MKKTLLFLLILFATKASYSQVSFGIKTGMNIATTKNLIAFPKNRLGWYAGGRATILMHKKLFLQPELLFSSKGHKSYNEIGNSRLVTRFNYINVPILLGYRIDRKTSLVLGPEIGYLASAQVKYSSQFMDVSKNYPSKFDAGLNIGLNYELIKNLSIEVRYDYGLRTLYSVDAVGNRYSESKGANRVFQIGINYGLK
jgi:hypothetical protein